MQSNDGGMHMQRDFPLLFHSNQTTAKHLSALTGQVCTKIMIQSNFQDSKTLAL